MKRASIAAAIALLIFSIYLRQHSRRVSLEAALARTQAQAIDAEAEEARIASSVVEKRRELAQRSTQPRFDNQVGSLASATNTATQLTIPSPDPTRGGGWSKDCGFCYFPKSMLNAVGYRPVENRRITDETAAVFGMSAAERAATDQAIEKLFDNFRELEHSKMRAVEPPDGWKNFSLGGATNVQRAIAFEIPELSNEISNVTAEFGANLNAALGETRGAALNDRMKSHALAEFDDLGRDARRVGFVWAAERDGSTSLWYATGDGNFQRVHENVRSDSQIAYYAAMFGVQLPAPGQPLN